MAISFSSRSMSPVQWWVAFSWRSLSDVTSFVHFFIQPGYSGVFICLTIFSSFANSPMWTHHTDIASCTFSSILSACWHNFCQYKQACPHSYIMSCSLIVTVCYIILIGRTLRGPFIDILASSLLNEPIRPSCRSRSLNPPLHAGSNTSSHPWIPIWSDERVMHMHRTCELSHISQSMHGYQMVDMHRFDLSASTAATNAFRPLKYSSRVWFAWYNHL